MPWYKIKVYNYHDRDDHAMHVVERPSEDTARQFASNLYTRYSCEVHHVDSPTRASLYTVRFRWLQSLHDRLTDGQRGIFARIYPGGLEGVREDQVDRAIHQMEATLDKTAREAGKKVTP